MLFNSYVFILLFLPVALAGYFLLGRRVQRRLALAWLVLCSLFFYAWWNPAYLGLLLFSILFNYGVGAYLGSREGSGLAHKWVLGLGVALNVGLLGYFKYAGFFLDTISAIGGRQFGALDIILPLGISFFTFQQIAYLVDAYKGLTREYNFLAYCLFVTFFPQLIAGPIVHHKEMLPQFARLKIYTLRRDNLSIGITIFIAGLFKKVMIADSLSPIVALVFGSAEAGMQIGFAEAWLGALCYTFQIYFDFSGYSDMAIGIGRMFGIRLPLNFNSPYKAVNVIDFWRRWHMTLSRFLRDYLYIPLGGGQKGKRRRYVNLMVTMLLGGLWHGAGWTFVIWGGVHGLLLVINHAWRASTSALGLRSEQPRAASVVASRTVTFLAIVVAWVFFRSVSFTGAWNLLSAMAGANGLAASVPSFEMSESVSWVAGLLLFSQLLPSTQQIMVRYRPALGYEVKQGYIAFDGSREPRFRWVPSPLMAVAVAAIGVITLLNLVKVSEFIYWQF